MNLLSFRRQAIASAITASVLSCAPVTLLAASSEPASENVTTIIIREVIPVDISNTPGAAGRLTEEELALLRPYTLHDAFAFIAGVKTIDDDVLGRRSAIGIRGAPSRRSRKTLLLEDGTPINFSAYLDPSSHYTPPMERLETVDVLKGAGHVLHGPLNNHGIINFRNKQATIAGDPGPHDPKQEDSNFLALPSLSLLYDGFGDTTQLFANTARGYTPAFARTAEGFPLKPETGINTQLGVRSQIAGVSVEAALFYNRIKDTIVQLPFTVNDMNIHLNSADSMSRGVDLGARIESATFRSSPFNFFAQVAWNYTEAEFTEDYLNTGIEGNRVPEVPLHAGSVTFGVDHASGWHASATVSHFGSFYTDPLNTRVLTLADEDREPVQAGDELEIREPAVLGRVPEHTLVSARLSYTLPARDLSFWLQARNLTDKLYISDLENGIRPGAERTVTAGVRLQF